MIVTPNVSRDIRLCIIDQAKEVGIGVCSLHNDILSDSNIKNFPHIGLSTSGKILSTRLEYKEIGTGGFISISEFMRMLRSIDIEKYTFGVVWPDIGDDVMVSSDNGVWFTGKFLSHSDGAYYALVNSCKTKWKYIKRIK